jgi:hypothetical protein
MEPRYFAVILDNDGDVKDIREFKTVSQLNSLQLSGGWQHILRLQLDENGLQET